MNKNILIILMIALEVFSFNISAKCIDYTYTIINKTGGPIEVIYNNEKANKLKGHKRKFSNDQEYDFVHYSQTPMKLEHQTTGKITSFTGSKCYRGFLHFYAPELKNKPLISLKAPANNIEITLLAKSPDMLVLQFNGALVYEE